MQSHTHKVHSCGISMLPVRSYFVCEGDLHGNLHGTIDGIGVDGWARRRAPLAYAPNG